jgi:protein gp37
MADSSNIEWTDSTWNPTTGCDKVSPGCDNCYAMTLAPRLKAMGSAHYQRDGQPPTSGPGFGVSVHPDALTKPLEWKRSRRIFVNSMSDLFHAEISDEFIARVFAVMAQAPQHTFQVLTKRHARMRSLLSSARWAELLTAAGWPTDLDPEQPLPNVWLGVSVENQQWADIRIRALLGTPAAIRFLSCEPLLGPVDLTKAIEPNFAMSGWKDLSGLHWVIVGGESGRGARPMEADWAREIRDQCVEAGVAFHFKQWGSHDQHGEPMHKKAAGRMLDGRTWDEFPSVGA